MREDEDFPPELPRSSDKAVASYQAHVEDNLARQRSSFRGHLGSFVGVNGMLLLIWAITPGTFPWFLFPLFGWGVGLSSHYAALRSSLQEYRNLALLGRVSRNVANLYRKLAKSRRSWTSHLVSSVATSALLLMINMVTSPGFPWSLFPIGGMAIGLFSHHPSFRRKERRLLRQLTEEGVDVTRLERGLTFFSRRLLTPGGRGRRKGSGYASPEIAEAERLRDSVLRQLEGSEQPGLGEDFREALESFVAQIKELAGTRREVDQIISEIPREALQRDLQELRRKRRAAETERLREEYESSIEEVEKQERSYHSLREDAEMIELRISSAMNALRQINIDLLRMRTASKGKEAESAEELRKRTAELSRYIDDLHTAYEELE